MIHSHILDKNTRNKVIVSSSDSENPSIEIYKHNNNNNFIQLPNSENFEYKNNNIWVSFLNTPNEDCYLIIKFFINNQFQDYLVLRVGNPKLKVFYKNFQTSNPIIKQYDLDGVEITNDSLTEIETGFYYYELTQQFSSIIEIDGIREYLKLPYIIVSVGGGSGSNSGLTADFNFFDASNFLDSEKSYATFGFLGDKNSYFDLNLGQWIHDENVVVKASDLAMAVCFKYNLSFTDPTSEKFIYNYIKYIQTFNEEMGQFLVYIPGISPLSDINNFELIVKDEFGNEYLRGLQMLVTKPLEETQDGSKGIIIPYTNRGL